MCACVQDATRDSHKTQIYMYVCKIYMYVCTQDMMQTAAYADIHVCLYTRRNAYGAVCIMSCVHTCIQDVTADSHKLQTYMYVCTQNVTQIYMYVCTQDVTQDSYKTRIGYPQTDACVKYVSSKNSQVCVKLEASSMCQVRAVKYVSSKNMVTGIISASMCQVRTLLHLPCPPKHVK